MNLSVSGHQIEITPAIRDYVSGKLVRIKRHFDRVLDVHVIISSSRIGQKAEVTLHLRGKDLYCESEDRDLYAAIDLLVDKLDRQVLRHKEKRVDKSHDGLRHR